MVFLGKSGAFGDNCRHRAGSGAYYGMLKKNSFSGPIKTAKKGTKDTSLSTDAAAQCERCAAVFDERPGNARDGGGDVGGAHVCSSDAPFIGASVCHTRGGELLCAARVDAKDALVLPEPMTATALIAATVRRRPGTTETPTPAATMRESSRAPAALGASTKAGATTNRQPSAWRSTVAV